VHNANIIAQKGALVDMRNGLEEKI